MKKELTRMGTARVYLEQGEPNPVIHKEHATKVELEFYRTVAPYFRELGIHIPELIAINEDSLWLEYIPHKVTFRQLGEKTACYRLLAEIHQSSPPTISALANHQWTKEQTHKALTNLQLPSLIENQLKEIQSISSELFQSEFFISGDTNPRNWGRRENGEMVLFDWERFGQGNIVLDLTPLIQGMGHRDKYIQVAENYLRYNNSINIEQLVRQMVLAKAWIIVEATNIVVDRNKPEKAMYLDWFNQELPLWFASIENIL